MCSNYFFIETSGENDNGFITQSFKCIFGWWMYLHDELKLIHMCLNIIQPYIFDMYSYLFNGLFEF